MAVHCIVPSRRWALVVGCFALLFPLWGLAFDNAPPEALNVKVFPNQYVAAGKPFVDLAALEAWARPIHIRVLWLDSCGPGSTKRLLAAVERFHPIYAEGIQIRTFGSGEPGCISSAEDASRNRDSVSRLAAGAEYYATDESGRSIMP